jgi:hypothetical protein
MIERGEPLARLQNFVDTSLAVLCVDALANSDGDACPVHLRIRHPRGFRLEDKATKHAIGKSADLRNIPIPAIEVVSNAKKALDVTGQRIVGKALTAEASEYHDG